MARIGWNFGDNVATAPLSVGSGWSNPSPSAPPAPLEQTRKPIEIGFIINEPVASPAPAPPPYVIGGEDNTNLHCLGIPENMVRRSSSLKETKSLHVLERSNSSLSSRSSGQRSNAYERGLNDMADLMTPFDLSATEKQKIRERFALD